MRWPRREEETQRLARKADERIKREAAEQQAQDHQDRAALVRDLRRLVIHLKASEKRRRGTRNQRRLTTFRQWIIPVTAVGALIYAARQWHAMKGQWDVMKGQLSEMQAEQRAWVSLSNGSGIESLYVDAVNKQLDAKFDFVTQNSGRNPAVFVFVNTALLVSIGQGPYGSMVDWQRVVCNQPDGNGGVTLFPQSLPAGQPTTLHTDQGVLSQWQAKWARVIRGGAIPIAPVIVACIVYRDAVTGKIHHTPYAIRISKPPAGGIFLKDLPLQGGDLNVFYSLFGNLPPD